METIELRAGYVYWLKNYTAPKVFTGLYFECLLTNQKISAHRKVKEDTNIHLTDWKHEIHNSYLLEKLDKLKNKEDENRR